MTHSELYYTLCHIHTSFDVIPAYSTEYTIQVLGVLHTPIHGMSLLVGGVRIVLKYQRLKIALRIYTVLPGLLYCTLTTELTINMSRPCLFPKETSKGNTATATILISSTITCHLQCCCMAESEQKEKVHCSHNCINNKNGE
jgi:hypothetical protein